VLFYLSRTSLRSFSNIKNIHDKAEAIPIARGFIIYAGGDCFVNIILFFRGISSQRRYFYLKIKELSQYCHKKHLPLAAAFLFDDGFAIFTL